VYEKRGSPRRRGVNAKKLIEEERRPEATPKAQNRKRREEDASSQPADLATAASGILRESMNDDKRPYFDERQIRKRVRMMGLGERVRVTVDKPGKCVMLVEAFMLEVDRASRREDEREEKAESSGVMVERGEHPWTPAAFSTPPTETSRSRMADWERYVGKHELNSRRKRMVKTDGSDKMTLPFHRSSSSVRCAHWKGASKLHQDPAMAVANPAAPPATPAVSHLPEAAMQPPSLH